MEYIIASMHLPLAARLMAGLNGTVYSVHAQALNMVLGGEWVSVVLPAHGNGPNAMVTAGSQPLTGLGWRPNGTVWTGNGYIGGPGGHRLRWPAATPWEPPPRPTKILDRAALEHNCLQLARALAALGRPEGLLPAALTIAGRPAELGPLGELGLAAMRQLLTHDAQANMGRLVGLGPGLTPSGDDVLSGFIVLRHRAGQPLFASGLPPPAATTPLSRHLLSWALRGVCGEHALALADTLLTRTDNWFLVDLPLVLGHGATSGSDWAAGALLGLISLTKKESTTGEN